MTDAEFIPRPCDRCGSANVGTYGQLGDCDDEGPACLDCGWCITTEDLSLGDARRLWNQRPNEDSLRADLDAAKGVLRDVEWGASFYDDETDRDLRCCVACSGIDPREVADYDHLDGLPHIGHADDCKLRAALAEGS